LDVALGLAFFAAMEWLIQARVSGQAVVEEVKR
jgi:hypothetical protein